MRFVRAGLDWGGLSGRGAFAFSVLLLALACGAQALVPSLSLAQAVLSLLVGACFVLQLGHARRRIRDLAWAGWTIWLTMIPLIGLVVSLILMLRKGHAKARPGPYSRLGFAAACLVGLALASRAMWAPFWIPSGSMKPNLLVGDYLVVTRALHPPKPGDVVVFHHPVQGSDFIKRVIGTPGDTVQIQDGRLMLNGTPVGLRDDGVFSEPMARQRAMGLFARCSNSPVPMGQTCIKARQIETLPNGRSYPVLDIAPSRQDSTGRFTVPDGHYFVLGDNRDNSNDSRTPQRAGGVGFVPAQAIVGQARRIVFSSAGPSMLSVWTWRPHRYFQRIL